MSAVAIIDVDVGSTAWVDITTESSIDAGTALELMNKGVSEVYVQLSAEAPSGDKEGFIMTNIDKPSPTTLIPAGGALKVWARAARRNCVVGVRDNS